MSLFVSLDLTVNPVTKLTYFVAQYFECEAVKRKDSALHVQKKRFCFCLPQSCFIAEIQYNSEFGPLINSGKDRNISVLLAWFFLSTAYMRI